MNAFAEINAKVAARDALAVRGPYAVGPFVYAVANQVASMATDPEGTPRTLPEAFRVVASDLIAAAYSLPSTPAPTLAPTFCPACGKGVTIAGTVFCESGEYDDDRGEYANEGDATVYACANGHSFAWEPPYSEGDEVDA